MRYNLYKIEFRHFKRTNNLVSFDKCKHLCNHWLNQEVENFHHPQKFPQSLLWSIHPSQGTVCFLLLQISVSFSRITYTWNHIICFLSVWLLSLNTMILKSSHAVYQYFSFFLVWIKWNLSIYFRWKFGLFTVWGVMNKAVITIHIQAFVWKKFFSWVNI